MPNKRPPRSCSQLSIHRPNNVLSTYIILSTTMAHGRSVHQCSDNGRRSGRRRTTKRRTMHRVRRHNKRCRRRCTRRGDNRTSITTLVLGMHDLANWLDVVHHACPDELPSLSRDIRAKADVLSHMSGKKRTFRRSLKRYFRALRRHPSYTKCMFGQLSAPMIRGRQNTLRMIRRVARNVAYACRKSMRYIKRRMP